MKPIAAACLIILLTVTLRAGTIAPLGSLLERIYPTLRDDDVVTALITLRDKPAASVRSAADARKYISDRSIARRIRFLGEANVIDRQDLPLNPDYVAGIASRVRLVRHELKWFNAVSVEATKRQIEEIRTLPYVAGVELVNRWKATRSAEEPRPVSSRIATPDAVSGLDYGPSFTQLNQINVPAVHNLGIYGQGVVVGVFDNGFRLLTHEAFASMNIIAQHDFVDHKESVIPNNPSTAFGSHGVNTLSTIGGYKPGSLIGPAFKASFILARTENDSSETPIEEDNWAAAIQWADSIGVDVTSTSLGYDTFDPPYTSLTWADMNGHTAIITIAADRAVGLGIVVVNSAGNSGAGDGVHNTLLAPADGDSVIAAGAVTSAGVRTSFSSVGPTSDVPPRIKPDVMAMGSGVIVASSTITNAYGSASGTSFSCPLSAGVAALIRCANPTLTPMQVRDAMRLTASNAASPDNLIGWGILNADSAIKYFGAIPKGSIHVEVYDDLNGNGIFDPGEPLLPNTRVRLSGSVTDSALTDGNGTVVFTPLPIGSFGVTTGNAAGWITTSRTAFGPFTLLHAVDTLFRFGLFRRVSYSGIVFDDVNQNGIHDAGEPGQPDRTVILAGAVAETTVTGPGGNFSFPDLPPGAYTVTCSGAPGWVQTFPPDNGSFALTAVSGHDSTTLNFGSVQPGIVPFTVTAGWNLLSIPGFSADPRTTVLFPSAASRAYVFNRRYQVSDSLFPGTGFWLKFTVDQTIPNSITSPPSITADLVQGWNMIGGIDVAVPVTLVAQDPPGFILSPYFSYDGVYHQADTLLPLHGYWVKTSAPGRITIAPGPTAASGGMKFSTEGLSSIIVTDARGLHQTLFIGSSGNAERFQLPPIPPDGAFDVRFRTGSLLLETGNDRTTTPLDIRSAAWPVTLAWTVTPGRSLTLTADGSDLPIAGSGRITLGQPSADLTIRSSATGLKEVPYRTRLVGNLPNPFNPSTTVYFELNASGTVSLKIFDALGREVATLADGMMTAGEHRISWNAAGQAGGIYYCRLIAGSFAATKPMVLIR